MPILKIQKRDGRVQDFDRVRIERAVEKACVATRTPVSENFFSLIAVQASSELEERFHGKIPCVEDVQDIVERKIAEAGFFAVSKAYILYRKDRERARERREKEIAERSIRYATREGRITEIKKREGNIVEFDPSRIERAIEKACVATGVSIPTSFIGAITDDVIEAVEKRFHNRVPGVEDVQDVIEQKLAEHGLFEVSKAYILYRKERERIREEENKKLFEKIEQSDLTVRKRDGSIAVFDIREVRKALLNVSQGFEERVDVDEIIAECKRSIYDGISTRDINKAVIMALRGRIERDPLFSSLAARFLFNDLYKDIFGVDEFQEGFLETYRSSLRSQIESGVRVKRLDPRMLEFDFEKLSVALRPERDGILKYLGAQTLYDRYFLRDYDQNILETPQYFWMRVAMGISLDEKREYREERVVKFYDVMSLLRYVPSTPTLFHSGTLHPQMSSCYLTTVLDDLKDIFKAFGDNAQLSKWSGGVANDWSNIRGTGSMIKSTNVGSQGVIPFLKIVDATTAAINRSGKRRGATCVYLETWHYDIESFLELRKNTGDDRRRTHDTNTANWVPDLFMKRVEEDGEWTLFSSEEVSDLHHIYGKKFEERYAEYEKMADAGGIRLWKRMRARELWRKMLTMLYETGHPWITFKDACNIRSPQDHVGVVHSSNLCTEITLNTSSEETAVCNLGSINLAQHIEEHGLNRDLLERTTHTAMRMLDNVIDLNFYPTVEAERSNLRHRPVGLGIMGLQDALYLLGMAFDTEEAVTFSDEFMEFVSYHAILSSSELAKERGTYSSYAESKWERGIFPVDTLKLLEEERGISTELDLSARMDWAPLREHVRIFGMRNSNCMAIAPTATNANINGCVPSIEPIYKNVYTKSNFSGEFTVINDYLVGDLQRLGIWDSAMIEKLKYYDGSVQKILEIPEGLRVKYKEVFEIDSQWLVRHTAYRGKWIDQSQSFNIFTNTKSGKLLSDIYMQAWKMGVKTTYYLRTMAASGIEKSTLDINKKYEFPKVPIEEPVAISASFSSAQPPSFLSEQVGGFQFRASGEQVRIALEEAPVLAYTAPSRVGAEIIGEVCEACE